MKKGLPICGLAVVLVGLVQLVIAQPPPPHLHRLVEKRQLKRVPATVTPELSSQVSIEIVGEERVIKSNGIPNHKTGSFPNGGNPNRLSAQSHEFRVPAQPRDAPTARRPHMTCSVWRSRA